MRKYILFTLVCLFIFLNRVYIKNIYYSIFASKVEVTCNFSEGISIIESENDELKKMLDLKENNFVCAKVISNKDNSIVINKGFTEGIRRGNIVINNDGLIGKVVESNSSSTIEFYSDTPVYIETKTGKSFGILKDDVVDGIVEDNVISDNDRVYTTNYYGDNMYIGYIKDEKVISDVEFKNINYVMVKV